MGFVITNGMKYRIIQPSWLPRTQEKAKRSRALCTTMCSRLPHNDTTYVSTGNPNTFPIHSITKCTTTKSTNLKAYRQLMHQIKEQQPQTDRFQKTNQWRVTKSSQLKKTTCLSSFRTPSLHIKSKPHNRKSSIAQIPPNTH